ncbi:MAG: MFS transporter [Firmicutes bacterium]|nr:MFS transporter [Bacillota bacterium]
MFSPYLWILSIGHLTIDLCQGALPILTPLLAEKLNLNYFQIGLVALAFTFSSAIIQPLFGALSDRYSMPWLMPLGLFLSGTALAMTGTANSLGLLLFVVLLSGIGVAGYHPEGSKVAHYISKDDRAGTSMAIFSVGGNLGHGLGPLMAVFVLSFSGLASVHYIMIPGVLAALFFIFLIPRFKAILDVKAPVANKIREEVNSGHQNHRVNLLFLMLYVAVRSWIQAGIVYFIPFYFHGFVGVSAPEYLVSIFLIAGAVGTVLGGPFADRFGGRNGLLFSMIISLITIFPFLHLKGNLIPMMAFISGTALLSTFSTTVVFGQRLLPKNIGLASGLLLGFGVGMGSVGVMLLGAIADRAGLPFTMNIICLLPLLGIIFSFTLPDIRTGQPGGAAKKALQQQG